MRNYEVLRNHVWTTRNGIVKYYNDVDLDKKDPNMYIFNANMSKGLSPLLNSVWPQVKARLPDARLTVIGGHYKLGAAFEHGDEESEFIKIAGSYFNDPTITFTGIISQRDVADLCAKASWFIYPSSLPETYGISTVESLYANTPLLTCKFGALEETATEHSWAIDYAISPNGLFPHIDHQLQVDKFVDMVVDAASDPTEYRKRQLALNDIKDILGWEVTALEWKQHIYKKLGKYLSRIEHRYANYSKSKYHKVFGRRYSTEEEWLAPKLSPEKKIVVISPMYNAENYIAKCIASVASQDYDNYEHYIIDDASSDRSIEVAVAYINSLPDNIREKFNLIKNDENAGAVYNHISTIRDLDPNSIVVLLDGDDSLSNSPDIFTYYNEIHTDYDFTYGSCWSMVDNIPLISQPYPDDVKLKKSYRDYKFNWNMPYTHLRTLKAWLLQNHDDSVFQDNTGNWYKAGGDNATFYAALEKCDADKVFVVPDVVCNYNDTNPINDYKVNKSEQDRAIATILKNETTPVTPKVKKKILIAIPTNRNIEAVTFKSIYDLKIPDGYETVFQFFWGYQVDQVRNLIAHWMVHGDYDYLFAVDSDISFPPDTLTRLLSHDKDIVSGVYIQRIPGTHKIEIMKRNQFGGVSHVEWDSIKNQGLVQIEGCGFGCALVKKEVFVGIEYPHFLYTSAIDHANTISEDVYFCNKAINQGFTIWCDTDVICDHTGSWTFKVNS
jgi:glycosyltransferase involved in cell wall biosynthesis